MAGKPNHLNIFLDRPVDPEIPGRTLLKGKTIKVTFPESFTRNPAVKTEDLKPVTHCLLVQGFQRSGGISAKTNCTLTDNEHTLVFTAQDDIKPNGVNAPGIKIIHLRGDIWINPLAGEYPIKVVAETGPEGSVETGSGNLTILPAVKPSINFNNVLTKPPANNNFQKVPVNTDAPIPLDFLLFNSEGKPDSNVGLAPPDLNKFPKYTGGLLIRSASGDASPDPVTGKVIGGIIGSAPPNATGQKLSPVLDKSSGKSLLSGNIKPDEGVPSIDPPGIAPGLLRVVFHTGNQPGKYQPTFELLEGNSIQFIITATGDASNTTVINSTSTNSGPSPATAPSAPATGAGGGLSRQIYPDMNSVLLVGFGVTGTLALLNLLVYLVIFQKKRYHKDKTRG